MKKHDIEVKNNLDITEYSEGDSFSKQYRVVEKNDNYIVVAKTFKNGNPKVMTKRIIFAGKGKGQHADQSA